MNVQEDKKIYYGVSDEVKKYVDMQVGMYFAKIESLIQMMIKIEDKLGLLDSDVDDISDRLDKLEEIGKCINGLG